MVGPNGEKRPGDPIANAVHVAKLATGELVRLFDVACPSSVAYYLVCPEGREDEPRIAALQGWIMSEASSIRAGSEGAEGVVGSA